MTALEMYTIYDHPRDYPDSFVVRAWLIEAGRRTPSNVAALAATLEEARALIPDGLTRLPRDPADDSVIVESWV